MKIRKAIASATLAAILTGTGAHAASAASASATDHMPAPDWGRMSIDLVNAPGPGGTWRLTARDAKRDGSCVRLALVNEDGTVYKLGPRSCGRTVRWTTHALAEDWPAPVLIHERTGETYMPN